MWGVTRSLTPSPPASRSFGGTGGAHAPTGPSIAGRMVKERRGGGRKSPPRERRQPQAKAPKYNALNSPYGTQKAFNKGVEQNARSQYQPELDQLKSEEGGEQGLHAQRQSDNVNIYKQFSEQAQQGFDKAKSVMAEIAARQNSSTAAGQAALQAALSNTGVSGLSAVPNQNEFMTEAAGLGNAGSQELAGMQSGMTGEMAKDLSVPGIGLGEATGTEQTRSNAALAKIANERSKVMANVPNIIAKTRTEMSKQEQEREANKLQGQIAQGKLGLEKTTQKQNVGIERAKIKSANQQHHEEMVIKAGEIAQNAGFERDKIELERKKINQQISEAKTAKQKAAAELAGKRYDAGVQAMAGFFKIDPKTEYQPHYGETPEEEKAQITAGKNPKRFDPNALYQMLTKQSNLNAPETFRLMQGSGNAAVAAWAREHEEDYNNRIRLRTHPPHQIGQRRNYVAPRHR